MAYNNKKIGAVFGCHILFVFKTSTFNSQNLQYVERFGLILIDFMCFSDKGFLEMYSVFQKKEGRFLLCRQFIKKILRQIVRYITHDSTDSKTMLILKVNFYCFRCILWHRLLKEH